MPHISHEKRIYAHRGASQKYPENTLVAFREGLSQGANALEFDLHQSKDGVIVVFHDNSAKRILGIDKQIAELNWQDIKQWDLSLGEGGQAIRVPRLEEVLEAFPHTIFNIDIKSHNEMAIRKVIKLLDDFGATKLTTLAAFEHKTLTKIRSFGYKGPTGFSRVEVAKLMLLPGIICSLLRWPGSAVQVPVSSGPIRFDSEKFIKLCQALGKRIDFWTINNPEEARRLIALGADGIMTDVPGLIAQECGEFICGAF